MHVEKALIQSGLLLAVLASLSATHVRSAGSVQLPVPLIKQPYQMCLVASVSMVLSYWGLEIPPTDIASRVPVYKDGTTGLDLRRFVESVGFQGFLIQPDLEDLFKHLDKGRPLIVTVPGPADVDHALVLSGYDSEWLWLNDPAGGKRVSKKIQSFQLAWEKTGRWTFLILPQ